MARPTVRVRIAFADGPYVASPSWTDVTTYVRSITTNRGRQDDWQNFDSGHAQVVLDNRDRRFDPTYTSSPYAGNLQPRRQIYIDATTDGGSSYKDVFRGFVDGWPVSLTDANKDSTVTLSCYDAIGLLAQNKLPADWSHKYITVLSPKHYWRLNDQINPSNIPSTVGALSSFKLLDYGSDNIPLTPASINTPTQNTASFAPGIESQAICWPDSAYYQAISTSGNDTYSQGSYCAWFSIGNASLGKTVHLETFISGSTKYTVSAYCDGSNFVVSQYANSLIGSTTSYRLTSSFGLNPAIPHHYAISWTGIGASFSATVLLDGVPQSLTASTGTASASWDLGFRLYGPFQQVATWRTQLSTNDLQMIYKLGANQYEQSTVGRFTSLIAETPWPASLYSTPASSTYNVIKLRMGGAEVNNELQTVTDSEGGELYTTKGGVLTMRDRLWYQSTRSNTNQATFGVSNIPIQKEMWYYWTAEGIRNSLDMTWSGDTIATVSDATSITAYGTQQDTYNTILSTAADATTLGNLLVGFGKLPRLVMSAVEVNNALSLSQWASVLNLELLDRITVVVDEAVGSDLSQVQLVQMISHEITPGEWRTSIQGSSRWSSVFTIGTSYLDGTDILG